MDRAKGLDKRKNFNASAYYFYQMSYQETETIFWGLGHNCQLLVQTMKSYVVAQTNSTNPLKLRGNFGPAILWDAGV